MRRIRNNNGVTKLISKDFIFYYFDISNSIEKFLLAYEKNCLPLSKISHVIGKLNEKSFSKSHNQPCFLSTVYLLHYRVCRLFPCSFFQKVVNNFLLSFFFRTEGKTGTNRQKLFENCERKYINFWIKPCFFQLFRIFFFN